MKRGIFTIIAVTAISMSPLSAQNWTVGYNLGKWDMRSTFNKTSAFKADLDSMGSFAEITGGYRFGKGLSLNVPLRMGVVSNPAKPTTSNGFGMFGADAVLQLAFEHGKKIFVPYLSAGLGANAINSELIWGAPIGAGLKFRLGQGVYLNAETGLRKAFKENRDNWQHKLGLNVQFDEDNNNTETTKVEEVKKMEVIKRESVKKTDAELKAEADAAAKMAAAKAKMEADAQMAAAKIEAEARANAAKMEAEAAKASATANAAAAEAKAKAKADAEAARMKADRDGDGIADISDRCPDQVGTAANGGCPEEKKADPVVVTTTTATPVVVTTEAAQVMTEAIEGIQFETSSSTFKGASLSILNKVVSVMKNNSNYGLSISGHTDNTGNEAANQRLSEQRAKACMNYLVSKGIAASRLSAAGYGSTQPRSDNGTPTGRAQNRRVEFSIR